MGEGREGVDDTGMGRMREVRTRRSKSDYDEWYEESEMRMRKRIREKQKRRGRTSPRVSFCGGGGGAGPRCEFLSGS